MRIVITGANGFIGKNLQCHLSELGYRDVVEISETTPRYSLAEVLRSANYIFHLAGVNRPKHVSEFCSGNAGFTESLCAALATVGSRAPIVFTSSAQAALDNPYGRSKLEAEDALRRYSEQTGVPVHIFRLTNVFGKWALPNYNSAVATFCHNITRGLAVAVNDPAAPLRLLHIDDVVEALVRLLNTPNLPGEYREVNPVFTTTVGEIVEILYEFAQSRTSLISANVGTGLLRALYSTYISYLPPEHFAYHVQQYGDARGVFVEMLKTRHCGQFSYFTAHPGVTRGDHYHHSKTEKFLVIKGTARFGFRHIVTEEAHELITRGGEAQIVETAPGWTHNITNIGDDELIVMLWANEIFDPQKPDTVAMRVHP